MVHRKQQKTDKVWVLRNLVSSSFFKIQTEKLELYSWSACFEVYQHFYVKVQFLVVLFCSKFTTPCSELFIYLCSLSL